MIITLADQLEWAKQEMTKRLELYPSLHQQGLMTREQYNRELLVVTSILNTLTRLTHATAPVPPGECIYIIDEADMPIIVRKASTRKSTHKQ